MKIFVFHEDFYGNVVLLFIENVVRHLKCNTKTSNKRNKCNSYHAMQSNLKLKHKPNPTQPNPTNAIRPMQRNISI